MLHELSFNSGVIPHQTVNLISPKPMLDHDIFEGFPGIFNKITPLVSSLLFGSINFFQTSSFKAEHKSYLVFCFVEGFMFF